MAASFDIITSMGGRFLNNQTFVYSDDLINIISNSGNQINLSTYIPQLLFNLSFYIPKSYNGINNLNDSTITNNPYIVTSLFGIFWLLLFPIFLIILIVILPYQFVKEKRNRRLIETGRIKVKKSKPKSRNLCVKITWRKALIVLMIISVLLWIIFLCLLSIEQYVISTKISQNTTTSNNSNQYNSLTSAVSSAFTYFNNIYFTITIDSLNLINYTVSNMNTSINNQINSSIYQFMNQFLGSMQVTNLFNHASTFIDGLNLILDSMAYINQNKTIFSTINQIKGGISVYQSDINRNLQILCPKLATTPSLRDKCASLTSQNTIFGVNISTDQINTDSSVIMLFLIRMLQINMTSITLNYRDVYTTFNNSLNGIVRSAMSSIDVSPYLGFITSLWQSSIIPFATTYFTPISSYNNQTTSAMNTFYIAENAIIISLIVLISLFVILILISFFRQSLIYKNWNPCLNFFIQIFILIFSFIGAIVAIAFLLGASYINVTVCQQFNTTYGINISDQLINRKLQQPWQDLVTNIISNRPDSPINLMQPTNLISAVNTRCRNTSIGLFTAAGMSNFVNITNIIQNSGIYTTLINTQTVSYASFNNSGSITLIPSNMINSLNQLKTNISILDGYDYTVSIQQLQTPLLGVSNFTLFINDLYTFVQNSIALLGQTNELIALNQTATTLLQNLNNYIITQNLINIMATKYQNLQTNRNNSYLANLLVDDMMNVTNNLSNSTTTSIVFFNFYNQIIITNMMASIIQILSSNITSLTNQLLPCNNLSLILEAVTTSICSNNNMKDSLASVGLLLVMVVVVTQFISLLMIIASILYVKFPRNISTC